MAITDSWLKAQHGKEQERTQVKNDRDGLGARVSPKGKITFQVRYRFEGKQHRIDVGTYPITSLKQAREEALQVRRYVEEGSNPRIERELIRLERKGGENFEALFRDWYASYCVKQKKSPEQILRSFEIHCFPHVGHLPADKIATERWLTLLEDVRDLTPAIAERLLINTKQAYKWAERRRRVHSNPVLHIGSATDLRVKKKTTVRVLNDKEIALMWEALERSRITPKNRLFVKLALFYGCRNGELRLSNRGDWDLEEGVWTVPAEHHKTGLQTGKPLKRPITGPVRRWIEEAIRLSPTAPKGGAVFNNNGSRERMTDSASLAPPYNLMQWTRRHKKIEVLHWSMHDLRRTMRTNMSRLAPYHVAETMVGHKLPGEQSVYDHYDYLDEQRAGYDAWWEKIQEIVETHAAMRAS
ncbi:tyrosine-type recombinase/integrase [Vreelandella sp. 21]|uniref:tyrosine-type recombinase/integrase n=1 Tax=Vreelandella sp. 21 TaxID=3402864 RepID=UPI003D9A3358